jgi:hypothetical protein
MKRTLFIILFWAIAGIAYVLQIHNLNPSGADGSKIRETTLAHAQQNTKPAPPKEERSDVKSGLPQQTLVLTNLPEHIPAPSNYNPSQA